MGERLMCPTAERKPAVVHSFSNFRKEKSQELIHSPSRTYGIIREAKGPIKDYYAGISARDPFLGDYYVTRSLRNIALSAALFNGATFTMNYLAPELEAYNADSTDQASFRLTELINPLPELQIFRFQTPQCRQFVQEVGGIMWDWGEVGILDPDTKYEPLAELAHELHTKFVIAEGNAGKGNTPKDMGLFLKLLAEDNAHGVLHTLIGLGGLTAYHAGSRIPAQDMASEALVEQHKLAGLASVSRPFAQNKIRHTQPPDWRAADVVAYERALVTGELMPRSSTESYFTLKDGEVVSPHTSLAEGEWSEAQMCAGFPPYQANGRLNSGNERFFTSVAAMVNAQSRINRSKHSFSSAEVGINLGIITGLYTIYPVFPLSDQTVSSRDSLQAAE